MSKITLFNGEKDFQINPTIFEKSEPIEVGKTYSLWLGDVEWNGLTAQQLIDIMNEENISLDTRQILKDFIKANLEEVKNMIKEIEKNDKKRLNDSELIAIASLVNSDTMLMQGENIDRFNCGHAAAWTSGSLPSDREQLIIDELRLRGIEI